jgi:tetratricopeptide (TPR) repeat protein
MGIVIFAMGLMLGLDALVSRAFGAGDLEACHRWLVHGVTLALVVSLPFMLVLFQIGGALEGWGLAPSVLALTRPYLDALTWSATVELLWSEAYGTVALFARELGHRAEAEAKRLAEKRDAGREFTERDKALLARATEDVAFNAKAEAALGVLSRDHLAAGSDFAREALRQSPDDERTLRVAAFYYLSTGMWARYEQVMTALEASAPNDAPLLFLRALEAEQRRGQRAEARQFLQQALAANPRLVRAQAKLVLLQDDIASSYAELQRLEALSPDHPVVRITGPSIKSEYELSESFDRARSKTLP